MCLKVQNDKKKKKKKKQKKTKEYEAGMLHSLMLTELI